MSANGGGYGLGGEGGIRTPDRLGKPKRLKCCLDFRSLRANWLSEKIHAKAAEFGSAAQSHSGYGVAVGALAMSALRGSDTQGERKQREAVWWRIHLVEPGSEPRTQAWQAGRRKCEIVHIIIARAAIKCSSQHATAVSAV